MKSTIYAILFIESLNAVYLSCYPLGDFESCSG